MSKKVTVFEMKLEPDSDEVFLTSTFRYDWYWAQYTPNYAKIMRKCKTKQNNKDVSKDKDVSKVVLPKKVKVAIAFRRLKGELEGSMKDKLCSMKDTYNA